MHLRTSLMTQEMGKQEHARRRASTSSLREATTRTDGRIDSLEEYQHVAARGVSESIDDPVEEDVREVVAEDLQETPRLGNVELKPPRESLPSDKKSLSYGSMNICLDGVEYSLKTLPRQSEEYEYKEIPDKLFAVIQRICFEEKVMSARLYQASRNCYELLVVGNSAEKAQQKLEAALKENMFEQYTIFTKDKHGALHVREYVGPKNKFLVTKEVINGVVASVVCDLVLEGDMVQPLDGPTGLFAVVSGHFILDDEQQNVMRHRDAHEEIKTNIAGTSNNTRYVIRMVNSVGKVKLPLIPTIFAYRPNRLGQTSTEDFMSCVSDIGLLQIESGRGISREQIQEGMSHVEKADGTTTALDVILPVTNYQDLKDLSVNRVCVKVAHSSGHMIPSSTDLSEIPEKAADIQFVLEDGEWPLVPGHSGSIVYVIDAQTGCYYRFGQFIGIIYSILPNGRDVYQASILRQSIDEIEFRYSHVVQNLRPIGQHSNKYGSCSNINLLFKGKAEESPQSEN